MLTVAQITDIHIYNGPDLLRKSRAEMRLRQVLRAIMALNPRPVAIVASGDLTDAGDLQSYTEFWAICAAETDLPILAGMGNHDLRDNFVQASRWPPERLHEGFVQYATDLPEGLRLVMCDSLDERSQGAEFCQARARWLRDTLDREPLQPTLVVIHHPPIASGIQWMDPDLDAPWVNRLAGVLNGREQVRGLICGHLHRPFTGCFAGHPVTVSAATDIQLTLNLTSIDLERPDGREILIDEPPGYAIHMWSAGRLTTHFCIAGSYPSAVFYERPFVRT